jgi:hypothetical protein
VVDRVVVDAGARLAEETDRGQLADCEKRVAVGDANPSAVPGGVGLPHEHTRARRRRLEPAARKRAHTPEHVPHDRRVVLGVRGVRERKCVIHWAIAS